MGNRLRARVHPFALLFLCVIAATCLALAAKDAGALTFPVNSTIDAPDIEPVRDTICSSTLAGGACTLRAAIQEASAWQGDHVINLPAGTYTLTVEGSDEDAGATGDLDIALLNTTDNLTITGDGSGVTVIDGDLLDRVLDLSGAGGTVTITGVTIRNGSAAGANGGGIRLGTGTLVLRDVVITGNIVGSTSNETGGGIHVSGGATADIADSVVSNNISSGSGGGISNQGTLILTRVTVSGNRATTNGAAGGIFNNQVLTVTESLIDNNVAGSGTAAGGIGSQGLSATITNTTISRNAGDGVRILAAGAGEITNCTVVENTGFEISNAGSATVLNTILFDNTAGICDPSNPFTSAGHNLFGDASCPPAADNTDLVAADPQLGPLQDNGGPTLTYALLPDSPAIDNGADVAGVTTIDQRGILRPQDGDGDGTAAFDIGAFERESSSPVRGGGGGCAAVPGGSSASILWVGLVLAVLRLTAWRSRCKSSET